MTDLIVGEAFDDRMAADLSLGLEPRRRLPDRARTRRDQDRDEQEAGCQGRRAHGALTIHAARWKACAVSARRATTATV